MATYSMLFLLLILHKISMFSFAYCFEIPFSAPLKHASNLCVDERLFLESLYKVMSSQLLSITQIYTVFENNHNWQDFCKTCMINQLT